MIIESHIVDLSSNEASKYDCDILESSTFAKGDSWSVRS